MSVGYQGQLREFTIRLPDHAFPEDVEGANGQHREER
jgi:hypothetical protein